jgi:hypothetical protein
VRVIYFQFCYRSLLKSPVPRSFSTESAKAESKSSKPSFFLCEECASLIFCCDFVVPECVRIFTGGSRYHSRVTGSKDSSFSSARCIFVMVFRIRS